MELNFGMLANDHYIMYGMNKNAVMRSVIRKVI